MKFNLSCVFNISCQCIKWNLIDIGVIKCFEAFLEAKLASPSAASPSP